MEVLILAKTHYGQQFLCVGGIVITGGRYVRLLNPEGWYQYPDTEFDVGSIWDISFTPVKGVRPPHVEDVTVLSQSFRKKADNITGLLSEIGIPVWEGSVDTLFEGLLLWTGGGAGYINEENGIPANSVGFWMPDRDLPRHVMAGERSDGEIYTSVRYFYQAGSVCRNLPYKGCSRPMKVIPAGTLVRVSLAKWWDTHGTTEARCALQLSGWYEVEEERDPDREDVVMPF